VERSGAWRIATRRKRRRGRHGAQPGGSYKPTRDAGDDYYIPIANSGQ